MAKYMILVTFSKNLTIILKTHVRDLKEGTLCK